MISSHQIALGFLFASAISILSYRMRWLTAGGAVAQFVLGFLLLGVGGWKWTLPVLVFFLTSSTISHLFAGSRDGVQAHFAKSSTRDFGQVMANGGLACGLLVCSIVFERPSLYYPFLACIATANADTWATELGTLSRRPPRMLIGLRIAEAGESGAVSRLGFVAAMGGSAVVAISAALWMGREQALPGAGIVILSGFAGCLIDSVLGAKVQGQWRCRRCARRVELPIHCGEAAEHESGIRWLGNDAVNAISIAISAGFAAFLEPFVGMGHGL